jgi:hypothetical protein
MGASTTHNPVGLYDLLQGQLYLAFLPWAEFLCVVYSHGCQYSHCTFRCKSLVELRTCRSGVMSRPPPGFTDRSNQGRNCALLITMSAIACRTSISLIMEIHCEHNFHFISYLTTFCFYQTFFVHLIILSILIRLF